MSEHTAGTTPPSPGPPAEQASLSLVTYGVLMGVPPRTGSLISSATCVPGGVTALKVKLRVREAGRVALWPSQCVAVSVRGCQSGGPVPLQTAFGSGGDPRGSGWSVMSIFWRPRWLCF